MGTQDPGVSCSSINKLTLDGGELLVEGRIDGLEYAGERERRRGFLGKLMG